MNASQQRRLDRIAARLPKPVAVDPDQPHPLMTWAAWAAVQFDIESTRLGDAGAWRAAGALLGQFPNTVPPTVREPFTLVMTLMADALDAHPDWADELAAAITSTIECDALLRSWREQKQAVEE